MIRHGSSDHISTGIDDLPTDPLIQAEFGKWCRPRRGQSNPEVQTNPVWAWLIETAAWPTDAHRAAGSGQKQDPGWCFDRFGQSETILDDGSRIFIGGEHEDFYDPDFFIYNDVVVVRADGSIAIYGYPEEVFQPTDFHTATKVGNGIYIVGCLGYVKDRRPNHTPVYLLDLKSFEISAVETVGEAPSWLSKQSAKYHPETHSIFFDGGQVIQSSVNAFAPNEGVWELSLRECRWKKG